MIGTCDQSCWPVDACENSPSSSCHDVESEPSDDIGDVAIVEEGGTIS